MKTISKISILILLVSMAVIQFSCSKPKLPTGENKLEVTGGNIWYKITGEGNGIPVVLLHGGPGSSSFYLKPFEELGNNRQVIRYDQLGSGKSDRITDTTLFKIERFVDELEILRKHLKIRKWHLLGQSWGTIIAIEYYKKFPASVKSIVFSSPAFSLKIWEQNANKFLKTLPDSLQQAVIKANETSNFTDPLFEAANNEYNRLYTCRKPIPEDFDSIMSTFNFDMYLYMQGASEFNITGTLKNYDSTADLPNIKVPTLFLVGEFDTAGIESVKGFANSVPNSKFYLFMGAAHVTSWDARDENVKVVRDFLNEVE